MAEQFQTIEEPWRAIKTGAGTIVANGVCVIDIDGIPVIDATNKALKVKRADSDTPPFVFISVMQESITDNETPFYIRPAIGYFAAKVDKQNPTPGRCYGVQDGEDTFMEDGIGFRCAAKVADYMALLAPDDFPPLLKTTAAASGDTITANTVDEDGTESAVTLTGNAVDDAE